MSFCGHGAIFVVLVVDCNAWSHWLADDDGVESVCWLIECFQLDVPRRSTAERCWALTPILSDLCAIRSLDGLYRHFIFRILFEPCASEVLVRQVILTSDWRTKVRLSSTLIINRHILHIFEIRQLLISIDLGLRGDLQGLYSVGDLSFIQLILRLIYQLLLLNIQRVFIILVNKLMHFRKFWKIDFFIFFLWVLCHFLLDAYQVECLRNIIQYQVGHLIGL